MPCFYMSQPNMKEGQIVLRCFVLQYITADPDERKSISFLNRKTPTSLELQKHFVRVLVDELKLEEARD